MHSINLCQILPLCFLLSACGTNDPTPPLSKEQLGQQLYFDTNLSKNRTQACATCHAPAYGFADPRDNGVSGAVSLGDDGHSLGDRNTPTATYAMFSPAFQLNAEGNYIGGQFHDGRASSLADQAGGPPTNPIEMGMTSRKAVVERLLENPRYAAAFQTLYGSTIFDDDEKAYAAMADSIASFERSELFAPFDSKYDRYLRGEYQLTPEEELGRTLFFSQQFTNCNLCHQLHRSQRHPRETFSNYEYHNIGAPTNVTARRYNGVAAETQDLGLLNNPAVNDPAQAGKFKVPTLRNVAITAPYMHNGIFQELKTVVLFYDKYNSRSARRQINPETGKAWGNPEVSENIAWDELRTGPALPEKRVDALVAFLKTLTDQRYEHLLEK